jgi:membrane-associated protease RseP (regulator of RpoE activity)
MSRPRQAPGRGRRALGTLALAGGLAAALADGAGKVVLVVAAVSGIVVLHELAHFAAAKRAGMKVTELFLGFGPRLWSWRRGETEYGFKALPAGGYCRILGMTGLEAVDPADEPRTFRQASFAARAAVAAAGPAVHFVVAFVLLVVLYGAVGVPDPHAVGIGGFSRFRHGPSPAQAAGLRPGDVVVSVNGRPATPGGLPGLLAGHQGRPVEVVVDRGGRRLAFEVTPVSSAEELAPRGASLPRVVIGVVEQVPYLTVGPGAALSRAAGHLAHYPGQMARAVAQLASPRGAGSYVGQLLGRPGPSPPGQQVRVLSVVGVVRLASQALGHRVSDALSLLAAVNVFLGMVNLVPLLPFDGGHLAVAAYERLRSRAGRRYRADVSKLVPLTVAVVALVALVGATALYLDIVHPVANPY